jgi:hypothetical protein
MDIKEQVLIKFWTWCGYHIKKIKGEGLWYGLPNEKHCDRYGTPELTLDIIYKLAIPKLQEKGYWVSLIAYEHNGFKAKIADTINDEFLIADSLITTESDNPTEALYNAIMEVIENEQG